MVLTNRSAKYFTFIGVTHRSAHRRTTNTQCLCRDEDTLGIEAIQQIPKSLTFFTNAVRLMHGKIVVNNLARCDRVPANFVDR